MQQASRDYLLLILAVMIFHLLGSFLLTPLGTSLTAAREFERVESAIRAEERRVSDRAGARAVRRLGHAAAYGLTLPFGPLLADYSRLGPMAPFFLPLPVRMLNSLVFALAVAALVRLVRLARAGEHARAGPDAAALWRALGGLLRLWIFAGVAPQKKLGRLGTIVMLTLIHSMITTVLNLITAADRIGGVRDSLASRFLAIFRLPFTPLLLGARDVPGVVQLLNSLAAVLLVFLLAEAWIFARRRM